MAEALINLHSETVYNGGVTEMKSQNDFSMMYTLQTKASNLLFDVSSHLLQGEDDEVRKSLNLEDLENDMFENVYTHLLDNPLVMKVIAVCGTFFVSILVYSIWSCRRCAQVRELRHEAPKENRLSKVNYLWAAAAHRRMDININKRDIQSIEQKQDRISSKLKEVTVRIDSLDSFIEEDKLPQYPPAYPEHVKHSVVNVV